MDTLEVFVPRAGPAHVLQLRSAPLAAPGRGQLRVKVEVAGVAYADIVIRRGLYPGVKLPVVPGYDFVGRIEALGEQVEGFAVGQRVAGVTVSGSYASHRNVDVEWVVAAPEDAPAPFLIAACLNGVTAHQMLQHCAPAWPGEHVLVHGATGGVGSLLVELAGMRGIKVIGTASARRQELVAQRGAIPVDYERERVVDRVRELSNGGVVSAFDPIGPAHLQSVSLPSLRQGGVAVHYGAYDVTRGGKLRLSGLLGIWMARSVSPWRLFRASQGVVGYSVDVWRKHRTELYRRDLSGLLDAVARGKLAPLVGATYPLEQAAEAHRALESRSIPGKIVLSTMIS